MARKRGVSGRRGADCRLGLDREDLSELAGGVEGVCRMAETGGPVAVWRGVREAERGGVMLGMEN